MLTTTYRNPVAPGFAPDPSVVLVDGIYYLVTLSFHLFPGLPIYASINLTTWTLIGHGINRVSQLSLKHASTVHLPLDTGKDMAATGGLYAPTIRYHEGLFYIICTNSVMNPEESGPRMENFIISCPDPWAGEWSDPVYFPLQGIDPDLFFDDDRTAYVQGLWQIDRIKQPSCTIKQYKINVRTGKPLEEPREIWGGFAKYDTEGPHIYKKDGWYYLLVAEGGTFEHHLLSIARSRSPEGPYESCPDNPIMTADKTSEYIQNIGHGDLFQDTSGQWWACVLGVRAELGWPLGRESFLTPVSWPQNEWPAIQQPRVTFKAPCVPVSVEQQRQFAARLEQVGLARLSSETFEKSHPEYTFIRQPSMKCYRLSDHSNSPHHAIFLLPSSHGLAAPTDSPTFLGLRQRALESTAIVDVVLKGDNQSCLGLALYKDHLRHASIFWDQANHSITFQLVNTIGGLLRDSSVPISHPKEPLRLFIEASAAGYQFSYRLGNDGKVNHMGSIEATEVFARDFTGPLFGLFARSSGEAEEREVSEVLYAEFQNFTVIPSFFNRL